MPSKHTAEPALFKEITFRLYTNVDMSHFRKYAPALLVILLGCVCVYVWTQALAKDSPRYLRVAFLNIGQGDAIFVESPTGTQVLIDGGPDASLLRELPSVMDPFDRTLDAIVVTNPDQDHFAGFIPLLERYSIGREFEPGTKKTTVTYRALESKLSETHVPRLLMRRGMVLDLGEGAQLYVLYPDRDVSTLKPNDGSVVMKLVYGKTSVMLMGDATAFVESHLLSLGTTTLPADILKLGHHGSKTSSSLSWLKGVSPKQAIVSAGCHNSYGHPNKEVTERLATLNIPYFWTCKEGTIEFYSDGVGWTRK